MNEVNETVSNQTDLLKESEEELQADSFNETENIEVKNPKANKPNPRHSFKSELIEWAKAFVFAGIIVAVVFGFIIRPVEVAGHSMEPTLQNNDRLIEWMLFYQPEQGDVVILSEKTGLNEALVKRVIATAGQTVDISDDGYVLVDGVLLDESYISEPIDESHRGDFDYPITVPDDCIFVMGDNRNHSTDSRYQEVGFVSVNEVIGKVILRIFPLSSFGLIS